MHENQKKVVMNTNEDGIEASLPHELGLVPLSTSAASQSGAIIL